MTSYINDYKLASRVAHTNSPRDQGAGVGGAQVQGQPGL